MQDRHTNRSRYFDELAETSRRYFMPYVSRRHEIRTGQKVLEIGCGEGGNLLPFAKAGLEVTGIDIARVRIRQAREFFAKEQAEGKFVCQDIFRLLLREKFSIIICHDVVEHVADKARLLSLMSDCMEEDGVAFLSFPAWQMPFGGHQQICRNRFLSRLPFVHLLPPALYKGIIKWAGESDDCLRELLSIRETRTTVESFERLVGSSGLTIADRSLFLINPHYKVKFGLPPCRLPRWLSALPYLRNFLCSSCWYLLQKRPSATS